MKRLLLLALLGVLTLAACGNEEDNTETTDSGAETEYTEESNDESNDSEESNSGDIYEIGDTAQVESFEWGTEYEVTVNSLDQVDEYNGQAVGDIVINAPDTVFLGVVNLTVKNISDEPIVIGEYVYPDITEAGKSGGEQFVFDLSEEALNQELAPDEEATFELVYSMDTEFGADGYHLKFENGMPTETVYNLPLE